MGIFNELKEETSKRLAVYEVIRQSRTDSGYFFMLGLSALITTMGLSLDNPSIVIGGMLIAPLLTPLLALGLSFVTLNPNSFQRSILSLITSISFVLLVSFSFSLIFHQNNYLTDEILLRNESNVIYLFVAFLSGLGAAYSMKDSRLSSTLPGVAVSVSLLPPLCVTGIAIAQVNLSLIVSSFYLFIYNTIGIVIASALVFGYFKFYKLRQLEEREINKEQDE